jgi:cytochrome c551/c552
MAQFHRAKLANTKLLRLAMLVAWVLAGAPAGAAGVADGARLAVDHGCMNCHSNQSHTAPTLERLAERMVAKGDSPEVLRQRLAELRGQTGIQGHQSASDESLLLILQWLAQGAK